MDFKDIPITCEDQIELTGTVYAPQNLKAAVLIGPATGIRRRFYHAFASFLCKNGYGVLTFDNRGIADSGSEKLNKVDASLHNWGSSQERYYSEIRHG